MNDQREDGSARPQRPRRWPARPRAVLVAAIAACVLLTTGSTALGVSGLASSGSASIAQYHGSVPPGPLTGVLPFTGTQQPVTPAEQAQQPAVAASGQLPFTGFLAIPVLVIGLVLVVGGLLGRRMSRRAGGPTAR